MLDNLKLNEIVIPNDTKHQIYLDTTQPAAQEIGIALQTICKTFNTILTPLKALNVTVETKYLNFISELEEKSHKIPEENIRIPELATVGPALMDLSFSLDETEIRSMYMNLLLQSIDDRSPQASLRSFVQIIKQLSPFEARLLRLIYLKDETRPVARISVLCIPSTRLTKQQVPGKSFMTLLTDVTIDDASEETIDICLHNFLRLGLIELYPDKKIFRTNAYSYIESSQTYIDASKLLNTYCEEIGQQFNKINVNSFSYSLTSFGESFCKVCII